MTQTKEPNSLEAEMAVIGAILYASEKFPQVAAILNEQDFYYSKHRRIYNAMLFLDSEKEPIDITTVAERLFDSNQLENAGGRNYVMELSMSVATAENVKYYAKIVKNNSIKRQGIKICQEAIYQAMESPNAEEFLQTMSDGLKQLCNQNQQENDKTHAELAQMVIESLTARISNPEQLAGITSGFSSIDGMTGGLRGGKLYIMGARPSMGKSALSFNMAQAVARKTSKNVLFISLEMKPEEIVERGLHADSEVKSRGLTAQDLVRLSAAAEKVSPNLRVIDRPGLTINRLRGTLLKYQQEGGLAALMIDYLQLMDFDKSHGNRNLDLGAITKELKQISLEFDIPVVALSQLSRKVEDRQDKKPMLSDLRDSGSIEADADNVYLLYREDYYNPKTEKPGVTELIIAKQRGGETCTLELWFRKEIVKFIEPTISNIRSY